MSVGVIQEGHEPPGQASAKREPRFGNKIAAPDAGTQPPCNSQKDRSRRRRRARGLPRSARRRRGRRRPADVAAMSTPSATLRAINAVRSARRVDLGLSAQVTSVDTSSHTFSPSIRPRLRPITTAVSRPNLEPSRTPATTPTPTPPAKPIARWRKKMGIPFLATNCTSLGVVRGEIVKNPAASPIAKPTATPSATARNRLACRYTITTSINPAAIAAKRPMASPTLRSSGTFSPRPSRAATNSPLTPLAGASL